MSELSVLALIQALQTVALIVIAGAVIWAFTRLEREVRSWIALARRLNDRMDREHDGGA